MNTARHAITAAVLSRPKIKMLPQDDLPTRLRKHLAAYHARLKTEWHARPAAVLIPLYCDNGAWHALFTRRSDKVESHKGQVSFPGGMIEAHDADAQAAALREACEELGLKPADVRILGELDSLITITQFIITPVVGVIPWPYDIVPNDDEVASVFGVPLKWLEDPANLETRHRDLPLPGPSIPVHFFKRFQDEIIWGATARIVVDFLSHLDQLEP